MRAQRDWCQKGVRNFAWFKFEIRLHPSTARVTACYVEATRWHIFRPSAR
ncbi:unnamed protein product [Soboliphyme baturini]|uniref:Transposase n=1 Tax=Soboliphyme baturini TaxID=241478 RepID=A0A183J0J8_9BILA|nr:unnamed protein product [Soboliphyme baturini]